MDKAEWIWINDRDETDEYASFYETITYEGGKARIDISCSGDYNFYINHKLISFGQYADYPHYKAYDSIDLTNYLRKGNNEIKIICWHNGTCCLTAYNQSPGLIYEIVCDEKITAYSSAKTLCCLSTEYISYNNKKITDQLGPTYFYDSRKKDQRVHNATIRKDYYTKKLYERPVKKLILHEPHYAALIDSQKRIYDLGKEMSGFLKLVFKAPEGMLVTIGYGEHLDDGEVRRLIEGRDFSINIIGNGDRVDFLGSFRRLGCRYLQVFSDFDVEIELIGIAETQYPLEKNSFNTGNALRQKIYDTAVRTLELCMHEHYEDCPWREQALYVMDSRNQMLCGYYAFKEYDFPKACLKLMSKAQKSDKLLPLCFPSRLNRPIPFFSLMFPVALNEYGEHSGDIELLKENIKLCEDIVDFFIARIEDNGLVAEPEGYWNFYEWNDGLDGLGKIKKKRFALPLNCFLIYALNNLEQICKKIEEKFNYGNYVIRLRKAVYENFFVEEVNLFKSFSDNEHYSCLCNSLALLTDSTFGKESSVCEGIAKKEGLIETTLSMKAFEYDALIKVDIEKYREYVINDIDTTYKYMLKKGATSFWETIRGADDFGGAGSLCHGWSAIPVYYYNILLKR